jgi:hypothetical protein
MTAAVEDFVLRWLRPDGRGDFAKESDGTLEEVEEEIGRTMRC